MLFKGRSHRLRPKAHILDDPLGNPYGGLKVILVQPYGPKGPYKGPLWPYRTPEEDSWDTFSGVQVDFF